MGRTLGLIVVEWGQHGGVGEGEGEYGGVAGEQQLQCLVVDICGVG